MGWTDIIPRFSLSIPIPHTTIWLFDRGKSFRIGGNLNPNFEDLSDCNLSYKKWVRFDLISFIFFWHSLHDDVAPLLIIGRSHGTAGHCNQFNLKMTAQGEQLGFFGWKGFFLVFNGFKCILQTKKLPSLSSQSAIANWRENAILFHGEEVR